VVECKTFSSLGYSVEYFFFFFSSRRRHTRWPRDWSSDVCSSDLDRRRAARGHGRCPGRAALAGCLYLRRGWKDSVWHDGLSVIRRNGFPISRDTRFDAFGRGVLRPRRTGRQSVAGLAGCPPARHSRAQIDMNEEKLHQLRIAADQKRRSSTPVWVIILSVAVVTGVVIYLAVPRASDSDRSGLKSNRDLAASPSGSKGGPGGTSDGFGSSNSTASPSPGKADGAVLTVSGYIVN